MAVDGAISLQAARDAVLAAASPLPAESVDLDAALGLLLAEDIVATEPLQGFDNSAMDGYAVRAADLDGASAESPVALVLSGEARAGRPARGLVGAAEAIAISTGAMLPDGADAVVRVEDTSRAGERVEILRAPARGANIRRAGEDVMTGTTVLRAGDEVSPAALGLLAALGVECVACHRRPSVALVTSGDELTPLGEPLPPGAIRDSNSTMLAALIARTGARLHSVQRAGDSLEQTVTVLEPALAADVLVLCGGVSVGEHDHAKAAFARLGAEQIFWRIALKPGGPTWFGRRDRTLVFGLPGNPVSAFVTFTLLVAPALAVQAGGGATARRTTAALATAYEKRTGRAEAIRCSLKLSEDGWVAEPRPRQGSHVITSLVGSDALALLPASVRRIEAGELVEVELLDTADPALGGRSITT